MGMRHFRILTALKLDIEPTMPYTGVPENRNKVFRMPDPKEVTLAEYNEASRDDILAHRLSDYRRRRFSLILLPNVHVLLEDILHTEENMHVSL